MSTAKELGSSPVVSHQLSGSQGLPCPPRRPAATTTSSLLTRAAGLTGTLEKDLDDNEAEARVDDGVEHRRGLDPRPTGPESLTRVAQFAHAGSHSVERSGVALQQRLTPAVSGDKSTPLSVRTSDLVHVAQHGINSTKSPQPLTSSSSSRISPASFSVPISAVRPSPGRRLLSPRSVSARFSKPLLPHPYLNERTPSSSYLTSPTAMAAVDRRSPLSFGSTTPPLGRQSPEPTASTSFPISPLTMSTPTGMRHERRKAPPTWPDSPRGSTTRRARSPKDIELDSPGYLQTPSILRNIPPPSATPTTSSFAHTPLTAGYASRSFNSAPTSNARGEPPSSSSSSRQQIPPRDRRRREGIPKSYFVKSLHNLAPNFWNKPATADCRILIPVRGPGQTTPSPSQYASFQDSHAQGPTDEAATPTTATTSAQIFGGVSPALVNTAAFASTQTDTAPGPVQGTERQRKLMTFSLHRDYLVSQSTLFAQLLDDRPTPPRTASHREPPPSAPGNVASFDSTRSQARSTAGSSSKSTIIKGAKVLQTPSHVPTTIWLPLPDPSSFAVLAHVLYWGDATVLENALAKGEVTWQGVIKNTEYLGFDNTIKRILGSWFRRWVKVSTGRTESNEPGRRYSAATTTAANRRYNPVDGEVLSEDDGSDFFGPAPLIARRRSEEDTLHVIASSARGSRDQVMEDVEESVDAEVTSLMQGL